MKKSLVSVIVPYYKAETTIDKCLESIYSQENVDLEILLVVDSKNEEAVAMLKGKNYPLTRVLLGGNGISANRNKGIDEAEGEYLFFVDADDFLLGKDVLSRMKKDVEENEADMAIGQYDYFDGVGLVGGGGYKFATAVSSPEPVPSGNIC